MHHRANPFIALSFSFMSLVIYLNMLKNLKGPLMTTKDHIMAPVKGPEA